MQEPLDKRQPNASSIKYKVKISNEILCRDNGFNPKLDIVPMHIGIAK
jgi:hypothetical protein